MKGKEAAGLIGRGWRRIFSKVYSNLRLLIGSEVCSLIVAKPSTEYPLRATWAQPYVHTVGQPLLIEDITKWVHWPWWCQVNQICMATNYLEKYVRPMLSHFLVWFNPRSLFFRQLFNHLLRQPPAASLCSSQSLLFLESKVSSHVSRHSSAAAHH